MKDRYKFTLALAREAGDLVLQTRDGQIEISSKGGDPRDIVTNVDLEVNNFITKRIKENFPEDKIYSEEADEDISSGSFWSIDPIDGTSLFSREIPHFSIVIGYVEKGNVLVGSIYNPVTKELFSFERGKGAFLNDKKVNISNITELKRATIFLRAGRNKELWDWGAESYKFLLGNAGKTYNLGSSALDICFVGAGRAEAAVYGNLTPADIIAATGFVREAGGIVVGKDGGDVDILSKEKQPLIAANNKEILGALKEGV